MNPVLICQNIPREGPGLIAELLDENNIGYELLYFAEIPKPNLANYSALVVMGGTDSANDQTEKMLNELEIVKNAVKLEMPYLGVCLGMQVLVKATGGAVIKNPIREIAFRDSKKEEFKVKLTTDGMKSRIFSGLPEEFNVFQLHGETVECTKNHQILAVGTDCLIQAVQFGKNAIGLQYHNEITDKIYGDLVSGDSWLKEMNRNELDADYSRVGKLISGYGKNIIGNFIEMIE